MGSIQLRDEFFNHDAQVGGFYARSHVGLDIGNFGQNQNLLIEGIRGTGKTHLLRMVENDRLANFGKRRILPIYVSLAQITEHMSKDPSTFRQYLYSHIVHRCIETLKANRALLPLSRSVPARALELIGEMFGVRSSTGYNAVLAQIGESSEQLLRRLEFGETSIDIRETRRQSKQRGTSIGPEISGTLGPIKATLGAKSNAENSVATELEQITHLVGTRLSHQDASGFLLGFLKQLQIILDLDYSLILLDECSLANKKSQVEVFRLFHAVKSTQPALHGKPYCVFFMGAVYPGAETYYPTRRTDGFSFEPGQDCAMEFLQWDETDIDTYIRFFQEMLVRRADEVLEFRGNFQELSHHIFDDGDTFQLAACCAHGIPRRFWEILRRGYDRNSERILLSGVSSGIEQITTNYLLAEGELSRSDIILVRGFAQLLMDKNALLRKKSREGVDNNVPQSLHLAVDPSVKPELSRAVMRGVIHNKARMRTRKRGLRSQSIYSLDMAVAYTYRVIPPKSFVKVVVRDMPLAASSNFAQAIEIDRSALDKIRKKTEEDYKPVQTRGSVRDYEIGKSGTLTVDNSKIVAFFWSNHVTEKDRNSLNVGDLVQFALVENEKGYQAFDVALYRRAPKVTDARRKYGSVESYNPHKFGFLITSGDSSRFYFRSNEVDESIRFQLKAGDLVEFDVQQGAKGLEAVRIRAAKAK